MITEQDTENALKRRRRTSKLSYEYQSAIRRLDVDDLDRVPDSDLDALAMAIERSTPDQVAAFIQALANVVDDEQRHWYDDGYSDGLEDCEC